MLPLIAVLVNISFTAINDNPPTFMVTTTSNEAVTYVGGQFLLRWDGDLVNPVFIPEDPNQFLATLWVCGDWDYCYGNEDPNDPNWCLADREAMLLLYGNFDTWLTSPGVLGYIVFDGSYGSLWAVHNPKSCYDDTCESWQCDPNYAYTIIGDFGGNNITGDITYDYIGQQGDFNNDGNINIADMAIILSAYQKPWGHPNYTPMADLDEDGDVDIADFAIFMSVYSP